MRVLQLLIIAIIIPLTADGQGVIIEAGAGIGDLKIGQSYEEVQHVLGFQGKLKTYDDYLAEELFNEEPEDFLECVIGFDYYVKFEHLLTLPVSYVFFIDDKVNQIMVSSFPAYYFAIAKSGSTAEGLKFWDDENKMIRIYGEPALVVDYENFILKSCFYFLNGITFNLRDGMVRSAHIYRAPEKMKTDKFSNRFR